MLSRERRRELRRDVPVLVTLGERADDVLARTVIARGVNGANTVRPRRFKHYGQIGTARRPRPVRDPIRHAPLRGAKSQLRKCHLRLPGRPAAVDDEVVSGHEARRLAEQEPNRMRDLVWHPDPSQRNSLRELRNEVSILLDAR